jgi:signal recognition particle GTPase
LATREEQREMRAWKKIRGCKTIEEVNQILINEDVTVQTADRLTKDWQFINKMVNFRIPGLVPA